MQPVQLVWNLNLEEGKVYLSSDFKQANVVLQLDALSDWIHELQMIYDSIHADVYPEAAFEDED